MMVAWREMPGNVMLLSPSRRVRHDRLTPVSDRLGPRINPGAISHTVPCGTDHIRVCPRHFMPGYYHKVPTGQTFPFANSVQMDCAIDRSRRYRRFQ
jgi:hypothetical protein